ncbi:hypothetical protein [Bdellovibrio reynosensis]|uniref:Hemerythrin-like domain-containing protein n=1 Tax=Bdellovibrio reynosensis TaxID=2835041 RepID=A0ABY4C9C2_9BACT|nr:hypothetical protein [Bdellovibrio reynosensis]UOF01527.1 hypothetical protein MNR06_00985 [Bdellovibrio reynosensis]
MLEVINELREEHRAILCLIEKNDILAVIKYVEEIHHPKEEKLLFPKLAGHPLLNQGGPRCMYFRGLELDLQIYDGAKKVLKDFYQNKGPRPHAYGTFHWLKDNNPLNIPMEEHRLGHELSQAIQFLYTHPSSDLYKDFLVPLEQEYVRLLKLHIEKEDTCLFILAERILQ